jgi:hypothetical protein
MIIKTEFPHTIREIKNTWIPMSDGCRLAARLWLPDDAETRPVPAILEYIPYRKNDGTAQRDALMHPYFAGRGYACVRVDMRGSGDSDGILYDEYLPQEQDDALEVLAWIAAQPWCTGDVGIIGKSWGGFNGLQIAARRPPQLKAVISVASTDDRYADDVHYMGGCLLGNEMLGWASIMLSYNALPPDPLHVGERWREMWLERLQKTPPFVEAWLTHPRRDAFWKHGSVCENYAAITCPVYAVGGWADAYTNAIPRLLEGLPGPRKGLIGPWAHIYPNSGRPGPLIGFLQECLRWWDYWLKGLDTGIMDEPMLRSWLQTSLPPAPYYAERPGRWVAEPSWPSPNVAPHIYWLNPNTLDDAPQAETRLDAQGSQAAGLHAGMWCPYGAPGDFAPDQRMEDGLSLTFTSAPLAEPMEILGFPVVTLAVSADRPNALLAVRLCDVSPTGASALVTRGMLNLTHRESHENPTPLEPGRRYTVTMQLNAIGYVLPAGHRWRVAVSPTYWPWAWPSPQPVTLSVYTGPGCRLALPVRAPAEMDAQLAPFEPAESAPPLAVEMLRMPSVRLETRQDVIQNTHQIIYTSDAGAYRLPDTGIEHDRTSRQVFSIVEGDPLSAHVRIDSTTHIGRGDWRVRIEASSTLSSTATEFHVTNVVEAYEGHTRVFANTRTFTTERDMV